MGFEKNYIYKQIPSRYLQKWKDYCIAWYQAFLDTSGQVGKELEELESLLDPFNDTKMNRFFSASSELSDSDLVIISDMVRQLRSNYTLEILTTMVRRVSNLECSSRLAYQGELVSFTGENTLDSLFRLDEGQGLDAVNFPYYIEFLFELNRNDVSGFSDISDKLIKYLSVYKPVRLDVVIESVVNINTYEVDFSGVDAPIMDGGYEIDSTITLDFSPEIQRDLEVFVDGVRVSYNVDMGIASWYMIGGVCEVRYLGKLMVLFELPTYPYESFLGGWKCILNFNNVI